MYGPCTKAARNAIADVFLILRYRCGGEGRMRSLAGV